MLGLMQEWSLTVDRILDHAAHSHGNREIVSVAGDQQHRSSYIESASRARRASSSFLALGIRPGDRIATLAWNSIEHFEAWYAIMGMGAVCHTLNLRMSADQLAWIVTHAESKMLLVDPALLPLALAVCARSPCLKHVVILGASEDARFPGWKDFSEGRSAACWGGFDEDTACGLCYTSGTTGDPKGVLYSHRSNFLHTLTLLQPDVFGLSATDVVLPIVPMFHANAWGLVFAAPAVGAKLVLAGQQLDGESLRSLIDREKVTFAAAVPTVWQSLLDHLEQTGETLPSLSRAVVGGAACPEWIVRALEDRHGVAVSHAWGMTELSPVGTIWARTSSVSSLPPSEQFAIRIKQGRPPLGVELRIGDGSGDGAAPLGVKGFAVAREYYRHGPVPTDMAGFFQTGDIGAIDLHGFLSITDRDKDVIKSGGEWVSSIAIENILASHPAVQQVAVIGAEHARWGERPLIIATPVEGERVTSDEMLLALEGRIPSWWMPDDVIFIATMPLGPTGKIDKRELRERYRRHLLDTKPTAIERKQMSDAAKEEIRELVKGAVELMRARDFTAIAGAYTDDGTLLLPGRPIATGAKAIEAGWADYIRHPFQSLEYGPTNIEVAASGDLAAETGAFAFTLDTPEGPKGDFGKYIVVWRKSEDGWKIAADIINSDIG